MPVTRGVALWAFSILVVACGGGSSGSDIPSGQPGDTGSILPELEGTTTAEGHAPLPGPTPGEVLAACVAVPTCDSALPKTSFRPFLKGLPLGEPRHRGRDALFVAGAPQTLIAKFAYGLIDKDLELEAVDVFVQRGCTGDWEKLGTSFTSLGELPHRPVDGVEDTGGRVFFDMPSDKLLGEGRHRVAMVVPGDGSSAEFIVDVVPKGTRVVVSDVDGTLTPTETGELLDGFTGVIPTGQANAAEVLTELTKKGFRVVYVTSRPETYTQRTRQFLDERGFPRGVIHTSPGTALLLDAEAAKFKTTALNVLTAHGALVPIAIGNTSGDADAYDAAEVPKNGRIFFQYTDTAHGGRRIEAYKELLSEVESLPSMCK